MTKYKSLSLLVPCFLLLLVGHANGSLFSIFSSYPSPDDDNSARIVRNVGDATEERINAEQDLGGVNTEWLTDEQLSELAGVDGDAARMDKLSEFYDALNGEARRTATEKIVKNCYGWLEEVASEEEKEQLNQIHHQSHEQCRERVAQMMQRLDAERREQVQKRAPFCEHVWYPVDHPEGDAAAAEQQPHHHHHHHKRWTHRHQHRQRRQEANEADKYKQYLSWMSEAQMAELKAMGEQGKSKAEMRGKVMGWYEALDADAKEKATEMLKGACRELVRGVLGEEKAQKVKEMRESGSTPAEIAAKIDEWVAELTDASKKAYAAEYSTTCKRLFGVSTSRRRRDHHQHGAHSLEDYFKTHLSWLSDAQKAELRAAKEAGTARTELVQKVVGWYEAATGETKEKATELLKAGCKELIKVVLGEEKAQKVKEMKESGTEMAKIGAKIEEWLAEVTDEKKKEIISSYAPTCRKLYAGEASRRRRDHHHHEGHEGHHGAHSLEDYFKTHLSWLNDAQKAELKAAKEAGTSREDLIQKVMGWYDAAAGDVKERATELMKGGCRELIKTILGEEKAQKLKEMRESGTERAKIAAKVDEWLAEVTDEKKKAFAAAYAPTCKRLFGVGAQRRRRDHHGQHGLDDYFKSFLSWLNDAQRAEMKAAKEAGVAREELVQKVMGWYDAASGEAKEKAAELMKSGCRELIKTVLGEEKAQKVKEMRESGTEPAKIAAQIEEWLAEVTDEKKKAMAAAYAPTCKKLFGVPNTGRRRRDHHHHEGHEAHHGAHSLEDYFKTHLSWLNDAQKAELKTAKEGGMAREAIIQKVIGWYDAATGETKEKATELMKGGCRELAKLVLGEDKAQKLKEMRESGTDIAKISEQVDTWVRELVDERKKALATEYKPVCYKVFKMQAVGRMRRSHSRHREHRRWQEEEEQQQQSEDEGDEVRVRHNDNEEEEEEHHLEGEHHKHNEWLSRKQKKMLKHMKQRGHEDHEIHERIHEFYEVSPDEVKATAKGILQRGCESIFKRIFGEYKAEELIQMRTEGASNAEMEEKINDALAQIHNPTRRAEAGRFTMSCRRIFTMIERRRREVQSTEKSLEELFKTHLGWLSDEQKAELKEMRDGGKGRTEMQQKVMDWFGQLDGEPKQKARELLRDGCRELLVHIVGQEKADELKQLNESGATDAEMEAKANAWVEALTDEAKKAKAKEFGPHCRKIFKAGNN